MKSAQLQAEAETAVAAMRCRRTFDWVRRVWPDSLVHWRLDPGVGRIETEPEGLFTFIDDRAGLPVVIFKCHEDSELVDLLAVDPPTGRCWQRLGNLLFVGRQWRPEPNGDDNHLGFIEGRRLVLYRDIRRWMGAVARRAFALAAWEVERRCIMAGPSRMLGDPQHVGLLLLRPEAFDWCVAGGGDVAFADTIHVPGDPDFAGWIQKAMRRSSKPTYPKVTTTQERNVE